MQVQDIMSKIFEAITTEDSIQQAALVMREKDVGMLPIVNSSGNLLGTVTDRDIVIRGLAEGRDADALVEEVMTPGVVTCEATEEVQRLAQTMEENQVRRVIVVDKGNQVVGVVSLGDIAVKTRDRDLGGEVLERISQPAA